MIKHLLIVESPAKARTLKKYLSSSFEIKASNGHLVDLPPARLGVDISAGFVPEYIVIKGKESMVRDLAKAASKSKNIYLAPDPDREGEAIAWHIAEQLGGTPDRFYRVLFYELTKSAINKAVANPTRLNSKLYDSQQARRVLDRLVGYQISPLLWDKVKRGLSAGRVQSVALRLVVDREKAITSFVPQEYWSINAELTTGSFTFLANLAQLNGIKFEPKTEAVVIAGLEVIEGQDFYVQKIIIRERKQLPPPPFITSTLQQESSRRLGFTPKDTMSIAQRLYEGQKIAQDTVGLITYIRTDSTRLSDEAIQEVREFILSRFGHNYLSKQPRFYKPKSQTQDAHEAIRPTSIFRSPEALAIYLKKKELDLYRLIYNRFLACQMSAVLFDQTLIDIVAGPALFKATNQNMKFSGFTILYDKNDELVPDGNIDNNKVIEDIYRCSSLPPLVEGQLLTSRLAPKQHFTQPPSRFTEASLIKELENKGIGRPSTYAAILSTLHEKKYIVKAESEKLSLARRHLIPTPLGMMISDLLVENFPQIMEVKFTAGLEKSLDLVEEGRQDWRVLLKNFYEPFAKTLEAARKNMLQIKGKGVPTDIKCPVCSEFMSIRLGKHGEFLACMASYRCKTTRDFSRDNKGNLVVKEPELILDTYCNKCGAPMQRKKSSYGFFLACTAYPQCKNIKPFLPKDNNRCAIPDSLEEKCPRCGANLLIKTTRANGRFIACSDYPICHYSRGVPVGVSCPSCGNNLVEKTSRKGKIFFGCENYPNCIFAVWGRPVNESCPQCGHPFLTEKITRKGISVCCPAKVCNYYR